MPDLGSYYKKLFEQKNRNSGLEYIKTTQEYLKKKKEEEEEEKKKSQTQKLLDSEKKKQEEQNQKEIENKNLSTSENNTDLAQKIQDKVSKNIYAGLLKEEEKQNKINEVKNKYSEISAGYDFILKNPDLYDDEELNGNPDKGFILAERYKNLWLKSEEILNRQTDTQDRLKAQRKKEVGFLIDELYEERKRAKKFNDTKRVAKIDEKIKELRKERPLATGIRWLDNLGPTIKEVKNASTNFDGGKGGFWFFSADSEAAGKDLAEYNKVMAELKKYSDPYYKLEQTSSRASLSEMGFDDTKTKLGILLNRRGNYEQSEHYQKWLAENPEPSYTSEKFNINQLQDAESVEHRAWRAKKDEQISLIGHTAENHLERERQATRALEHFDRSAIVKMGSGALDALDNVITAGINDVITAKMYAEIEDKARNGVELTELEKEFAVSKIKLDEIRNMRQNEITNWEVIGEQGAHSVSFILQMGYSPAALATRFGLKTLSKQGAKYATKEVLEEGAKQTIKDKLKMGAAKVAASNTLNEAEKIGLKGGAKYFSYLGNKVVEVPATSLSGGFTAPMAWQSYYEKYTGDWIVTDKDAPNGLGGVLIMEQGQAERFLTEAKNAIDIKKNNIAIFYNTLEKYANAVTIDEYRKVGSIESLNPEFINKTEGFFSTFLEKPNENFVFLELKAKGYLPENAVPSDITTEMLNQYIINEQNQINTIVGIMSTIGTPTDSENGFFNTPRSQAFWYGQVDYAYEALSEKSGDLIGEFLKPIKKAADKNIFIKSVKESKPAKYLDYFNTSMENLSNRFYGTSGLVQSVPLELVEELDRNLMKNPFGTEKEYEEQIKQYSDPNFYLQVLGATLLQGGVSTIIRGGIDVASGGYKQTVNAIRNQNIYNRLKTLSDSLEKGDITSDDFITHIGGVLKRSKQYGAIGAASSDLQKLLSEEKNEKRREKLLQSGKFLNQINLITQFDRAFSEGQGDSLLKGIKKGLESQGIDINNNVFYKNLFKYSEEMKKIKNHKFLNDKHKQDTIDTLHNSLLNNIILDNLKESLKQQLKHTNVENFSLFSEEFGEEMLQEILSAKNSEEFDSLAKKHNLSEEDKLEIQGYVVYEKMLDQKEIKNNESYSLNMSTDEKSLEYLKSKYKIESSDKMSSGKNNAESVVSEGKNDKNIQSVHNEEVSGESSDVTRQLETLTKDLDDDSYILYNGKYFGKSKDGTLVKVDGKKLPTNAFIKKYEKSGDSLVNIELEREIDENPELAAMRNRANVSLTEEELKDFMAENDEAIQAAMSRLFAPIEDNELDEYDKQRLKNAFLYLIKKYHLSPEEVLGNKNFILSEEEVKYLKEVVSELDNKVDRLTREKWQNLSDNRIKELVKNSKNRAVNTFVETKKADIQEQMVNKQVQEKRFEQKGNTTTEYNILKVTISKIKGGIDKLTNKKVKIVIADRWENRMITVHNQKIDIIEYLKRKGVNADILRGLSFEGIKEKVESGELSKEHFNIVMSVIPLQGKTKDGVIEDIIPSSLNPRYNFFNSIVREVQDILRNNKYPLVLEEALQNLKNAVLNQSGELEALKSLEQLCEKHGISISNLIKAHQDVSSSALSLIKKVRQEVAEKGESKLLVKKVSIGLPEINEQSSPVLFSEIDGNKNFRFVSKRTNKNNESREVFVLVDVKTGNKIPHKVIANWDLVSTQYHAKPFVLIPTGRKIIVDILKNGKKVKAKVDEQYCVFIDDTRVPFENPLMKSFLDNIGFIYALINHDFSIPGNESFTYDYKDRTITLSEEQAQQVINQIYNGLGFSNDAKYRNKEYLENYLDTVYSTLIDESYNDEKLIRINFLKTGNEDLLLPMFNIIIDSNDGVSVNQEHSDMTISNFRLNVLSTKCKIENGNVVLEDFVELVDDTENNTGATTNEEKQKPVVKETKVVNDSKTNEDVSEEGAEQETEQEEDSTEDVAETEEDSLEEVIKTDTETSENSSTKEKEELDKKLLELAKKDSENLFKINTYIKNVVFRKFALKRSIKISEVYREAQKVLDTLIKSKPEGSEERIFLEKNRDKILAVKDSNNYVTSVRKMIDDFFQVRKSLTDDYLGSVVETDVQEEGYNVEAVYGKQSFEQDVTVSISTQVKMFLSGLSLLKDGIFYSFSERECYSALQEAMAASDDHTLESCLTYLQQRVQNCKSSLKLINNSGEEKSLDSNLKVFEALIERLEEIVNIDKDDPEYDIKMKLKREIEYSLYNNKVAMSFVYCYKNVFSYFNPTSIHGVSKRTVKESTILDANRRNALSKKSNALENNFRNLLYYDKKLRKFVFDINKIKELKWFISKFQNEYQKAGIFVQNGRVNMSAFEDLKHIFNLLGIELDDNTIIELFNNRPDENGVNPLEINAEKKHGYVIKYLTNLIEKEGQITKILEESEKGNVYIVDYVGGDSCFWSLYNTKTKKVDKPISKPILQYNGKNSSGKAIAKRLLKEDLKYTFNPVPGIYVGEKRVNSFENVRYINKQFSLIIEGLRNKIYNQESKNKRAKTLLDNLKKTSFSKYSFLLSLVEKCPEFLNNLSLEWTSLEAFVIKDKTNNNKDDADFTKLSEKDQITSALAYFIGGIYGKPIYTDASGFDYYATQFTFPALSDASVLPVIKTGAVFFTNSQLNTQNIDSSNKIFSDVNVRKLLFDTLVKGELSRIIDHVFGNKTSNVSGMNNGSLLFTLVPSINAIRSGDVSILGRIREYANSGMAKEEAFEKVAKEFQNLIDTELYGFVHKKSGDLFNKLISNNIITFEKGSVKKVEGFISDKFLNRFGDKVSLTDKISNLCLNFTINHLIATSDIYKLFSGDLACYNTDKMLSKYFFGKDVDTPNFDLLIDLYIEKKYSSEKAKLYKDAISDDIKFNALNDKDREVVMELRQYRNPQSMLYNTLLRKAYSDYIEYSLQNNLSKRLKGMIGNGKILSGTAQANTFSEAYEIMLTDVNSISKSVRFYYHNHYENSSELSPVEKELVLQDIAILESLENKKTLGKNQKIEYQNAKKRLMDRLPDIAEYLDIADTDGQEYSTWRNHLQQLLLQGRLTDAEYDIIYKKLESQSKLMKITPENKLTKGELRLALMQPTKPVHFGMYFRQEGGDTNGYTDQNMVYIKTSSFPLIPQLTKGFEIDKLRTVMEKLEKSGDGTRTARTSYNSGNKVGGLNSAMTFDQICSFYKQSPNKLVETLKDTYTIIDLSNYLIQQDKPFETFENLEEGKSDYIIRGTQMEKSIGSDGIFDIEEKIFPAEDFSLQTLKDCNIVNEGATRENLSDLKVSGKDLKRIYEYLYEKEQEILKRKLFDKFGITDYSELNEPHVKEKIKKVLDQRLDNNQDLEGIQIFHKFDIVEDDGTIKHYELSSEEFRGLSEQTKSKMLNYSYDFNIAIWTLPNYKKFESVLNSVVSNNSIRLKLPGGHGIVASQKGFEFLEQENYNGDVILTENFDGELKAVRDKDGKLLAAQVFMASKFRKFNPDTNSFELIDLNEYVIEKDGRRYLDNERVPENIRQMFSYRIPTSSHQSGMLIEIVGFLPTECGDLIIVPKDSTKQMGEDFDIDVRYFYQHHIVEYMETDKNEETGEIVEVKKLKMLEQIDPQKNYSKEIRRNYFDFLKTVIETKIKGGNLININDPIYNEFGINYLMRIATILSGDFYGENKTYREEYLQDLKENFGATDETILNIKRLIALIKNNKSLNDLQKYVNQTKYEEFELKSIENDLITLYKSVYKSNTPNVQKKITAVLSTDFLNDTANIISETKRENVDSNGVYSPLSFLSQIGIIKKGNAGKVGIGVWSSLEVFTALVQQCEEPIGFKSGMRIGNFEWDGTIGGKFDEESQSYVAMIPENAPEGFKVRTIFRSIMEHQNSATDNQKLQIMEKLNENTHTFPVYEMLTLIGADKDGFKVNDKELSYPALFMCQPIIKDYVAKCEYYNSLSTDTWFNIKKQIITELEKKYDIERNSKNVAKNEELTGENLYANLTSPNSNIQMAVLNTFFDLEDMFQQLRPYITQLNLEQKGLGISFLNTIEKKDFILSIAETTKDGSVYGLDQLIGDFKFVGEDVVIDDTLEEDNEEVQEDVTPQIKLLKKHNSHITFDESTHTYYFDDVPVDTSVTQLFNTSEQEDLDREHLTPMQVGATIGTKVDAIARDFFAGKFSDKNSSEEPLSDKYGVHKNNIEQIVSQLEEAKKLFDKKYGAGEYTIITDENLLRVAGTIQHVDEQGNVVTQTVAGTMDLLIIDKNGDYHIFDFKVKRESTPGNVDLDEKTKIKYKNQGESYAKLLQNIVGNKNKVSFESDLLLICSYPSATNNTYSLNENDDLLLKDGDETVSLKTSDSFNLGKSFSFVDMKDIPYNKEIVAKLAPPKEKKVLKGSPEKTEELEKNGYVFFAKDSYGRDVYIKPNGFYAHKIVNSVSEGYNMWKNIFPYDEKTIRHIIKSIVENSDVMPYSSSSLKLQYEIVEALQDYLYSSLRCFKNNGSTLTSTRKNMFFDFENNVSFAHYVQDVINSNPKYKNSVFFQNLDFQIDLTGKTPSVIIYNTNIERGDEKTAIYEMFKEMFESEEKLPYWNGIEMSESLFARFLVQYAYLSSQNGATSFRKLLPISTFSKIFSITDSGEVLDMKSNMSVITSPLSLEILLEDSSKILCKLLGSSINRDNIIVNKKGLSTETVQSLVDRYNTLYNKVHYYVDEIGNIHINSLPKRDGLIKQFFQHNPDKAHKLSSKRFKEEKSKNNGFIPTRIKISDAEVVKLPEFCVFYNEGKLFLYQKDVLTSSLVRINLLGNQYFHEYSFGGNEYSLIEDNNISKEQKEEVEKVKKQQLYKNANDVINEILDDTENKYYNLAEYLKEVVSLSNTKILYRKCGKKNSALFYDVSNKHIVINMDYNLRKDVLQEKLLHEIFHSLTTDILKSNVEDGGMMFEKGDDGKYHINIKVKENAPTVIRNLIRVYKDTILALQDSSTFGKIFSAYLDVYSESLNNGDLAFNINTIRNNIYKKHPELKEQLSDKEIKDMLYGLYYTSNIFEFVSGIFFNKTLLNKLNSIPVDSNNESLIDRFVKAITKMIDFLKSIMNIDVKTGHALEEVIRDITEIVYMNKSVEDIEDDEDVDSEGVKTDITSASDQSINVFDQSVNTFEDAADEYNEITKTLNNDIENLNAPIFTEQDITLGKRVTIDGVHYRMLDINGLEDFSYAVSKVNGVYEISAIQIDDFVTKTKFRHKDFSTLLYEFSKICDTFVKSKGNEFFENPFLFKKGENYNINNINKTHC